MAKTLKRQRTGLSAREERVARLLASGQSPKEATKAVGYKSVSNAYSPKIRKRVIDIFEQVGITHELIANKLMEGLEATKIVGTKDDFIEVPDYITRHKYIETLLKLQDQYPSEKHTVEIDSVEARLRRIYGG